jgi:hypothetical protein
VCVGAADEARCCMLWDMKAMHVGEQLLLGGCFALTVRTHFYTEMSTGKYF